MESKNKMSQSQKVRFKKSSVWNKGKVGVQIAWNKGVKGAQVAWNKGLNKELQSQYGKIPWNKGLTKNTDIRVQNWSLARKGRTPWNKGKRGVQLSWNKGKHGIYDEETIHKLRVARLLQVFPVKDTSIEVALQNSLREFGILFEKHKAVLGQPDIFIEPNICVFADGDYWHNRPAQIVRDQKVGEGLREQGYKVVRFWEHEINDNVEGCVDEICKFVGETNVLYAEVLG